MDGLIDTSIPGDTKKPLPTRMPIEIVKIKIETPNFVEILGNDSLILWQCYR